MSKGHRESHEGVEEWREWGSPEVGLMLTWSEVHAHLKQGISSPDAGKFKTVGILLWLDSILLTYFERSIDKLRLNPGRQPGEHTVKKLFL